MKINVGSPTLRLMLSAAFGFVILLSLQSIAAPNDMKSYYRASGSYVNILPDGSIVQGSASHNGIQPDYIVDFENPEFHDLRQYIDGIKKDPNVELLEKVELIKNAVSSLLEKKLYSDRSNYLLAQMYKEAGKDIPLSEYARYRTGVCREHALVLHKALSRLGVDNHFVYAKIERETASLERVVEDHAFNTIIYQGKEWVIDSYISDFNGFLFKDLLEGKDKPDRLRGISEYRGQRRILHLNSYPIVWVPKSAKILKCEWVFQ